MSHLPIIRQFLHERLQINPDSVSADSTLAELKVDSLRMLDLMFDLEEKLDIVLTSDIPAVRTVGELDDLLDRLVAMKKS
jgi:acyl carrier protein